jgi:flagellar biosynthesis anti-sigma factor FlgM
MRIDPNYGPQASTESGNTGTQGTRSGSITSVAGGISGATGEDQAHLSGAHAQVDALAAQASQLPEVRQERVQALRQTLLRGQYNPAPEQVAGALLDSMIAGAVAY